MSLLAAVEGTALATHLRGSFWTYPLVNAAHILGLALLVGAVVPLDLRLLGLWRSLPREPLARALVPVAGAGLVLAIGSGALLFAVQARDYATLTLFQVKMGLVVAGTANALAAAARARRGPQRPRLDAAAAGVSLACWLAALLAGRFIGYVI